MRILYTIGIYLYTFGVRIAALCGHRNARLMVAGWKQWPQAVAKLRHDKPVAWFHAASLGEFEQARPVLEEYRRRHPDHQVFVSFFSPSGYEVRKSYSQADVVCYLPMDTPRNARRLTAAVNPDKVFFVKYEFWYNYLATLNKRHAHTYIFSAIFRPGQYFFCWYGGWFRRQLKECFAHLFVQNEESLQLLQSHGVGQCSIAGDTRFDRVHQIALAAELDEVADAFLRGHEGPVLVCGSTWPPDERLIAEARNEVKESFPQRIILAPHVISEEHLKQIETLFPDSIRYSTLKHSTLPPPSPCTTLIVDNIGILSKLYRYATVAYLGGGFGVGIHNILEAVTFGKPVFFGPNYHKFQEARDIIARGGGWSVDATPASLLTPLSALLFRADTFANASQACTDYMQHNLGSTEKILCSVEK